MSNDLATILAVIKSAPKDIRRVLFFDADKEIQKHKDTLEGIKSGKYKVASNMDEYK